MSSQHYISRSRSRSDDPEIELFPFTDEVIDFTGLLPPKIQETLNQHHLNLTIDEIQKVQFDILKRPPSLTECILFAIEGSEHCSYKSSKVHIKSFVTEASNVILGAKEDAGIIRVAQDNEGENYGLVISHESHNHPSQIVPFEGAATGVGGNVRDVLCMGAEVVGMADCLRFGDINNTKTSWIQEGVVQGIAQYSNALGVPNLAGDVYFDKGYNDNCLVSVVTLGVLKESEIIHSYAPRHSAGFDIILIGKPTDHSGFGGASFASLKLDEEQKEQNKSSVQEPNPFLERHLLKSTYALFKKIHDLKQTNQVGFKDLGAGGIACASVELADSAGLGAEIYLDQVHVADSSLHPAVILCSETQERFMWICSPDLSPMILSHYNEEFALPLISKGARASIVGKIREDERYIVTSQKVRIVDTLAYNVTKGFQYHRPFSDPHRIFEEPFLNEPADYNQILLALLGHENIASKESIFSSYDKQIQGRTICEAGQADSGVITPFNCQSYPTEIQRVGVSISCDHNPQYGKISPYWGAVNAVVESVSNIVCNGSSPQAITDCLCYGNPENPEHMWEFVEGVKGIKDACKSIKLLNSSNEQMPIVAGNVSFYNESNQSSIPPSPLICCVGTISDVSWLVSSSFKRTDSSIFLIGERKNECGGSVYYQLNDALGANVPKPNLEKFNRMIMALHRAMQERKVLSCHDISEGGLACTLAEMCFMNQIGCHVSIEHYFSNQHNFSKLRNDQILFSESQGFVVELLPENENDIRSIFLEYDLPIYYIGNTTSEPLITIEPVVKLNLNEAKKVWQNSLKRRI